METSTQVKSHEEVAVMPGSTAKLIREVRAKTHREKIAVMNLKGFPLRTGQISLFSGGLFLRGKKEKKSKIGVT